MSALKTQILEELRYLTRHLGLNFVLIPFMTAVLYWMASLNPIPAEQVIGSLGISLPILISLFFSTPVAQEKLLGIHELLLSLPLSPSCIVLIRAVASFVLGLVGIIFGGIIGWILTVHLGNPIGVHQIVLGVIMASPLLFSFTSLVILTTFLLHSRYFDIAKGGIGFVAFFAPLYLPKYLGVGLSLSSGLIISGILSATALLVVYGVVRHFGERLGEKMVVV
ncbi:ABC-2 transporter permease [Palaeococcus ferrophilus]|uniref:ABC-2 transporter permease n=1 Tax=Palaeococcus ferrophilus TaxID=83868 RepID=UPI00064F7ED3|nr:ABC-2 transporter permease [Palaeococcus ferrophilus]